MCPGIGERGSLTVRIALRCRLSTALKGSRHVPNPKIVSYHFAGRSPHDDKASLTQEGSLYQREPNRLEHCLLRLIRLPEPSRIRHECQAFFRSREIPDQ
jgi:hypothetical protein